MKKIAEKMKNKYNITLHIISFLADSSTAENLSDNNLNLKAMAEDNGGSFFLAQSMSDVKLAIESIATSTISAVTYSSPGVAVDNFNMFQHDNFVHHSLFRPGGERFWYGNMKRFKLGEVGGVSQLLDKNDSPVVDLATGLFKEGTRDYWSNEVDGANVLKGGITTTMSKGNSITLFTDFALGTDACNQAFGNGDTLINATNCAEQIENYFTTDAMQGINQDDPTAVAIAQNYADRRYKWIFGFDHKGQEWDFMQSFLPADQLPSEPTVSNGDRIRKWLGAAIHSSPVVVNYTTQSSVASEAYDSDTESNAIFLGTNDGHFYAFNPSTGDELFRFLPEPMFKKVKDFSSYAKGEIVHGMDGNWTVWREDEKDGNGFRDGIITVADGDHVYAYGGMRRGGDYYYGLDLSNLSAPKLLFKVHGTADGATATYSEYGRLGETWSQPELVNVKINGASTVLLVFGGGHDTAYDPPKAGQSLVNDPTTSSNALGNAIYLVYAEGTNAGRVAAWISADASGANGTTHADMKHSIVSRLSTLDLNADGYVDHIYAADLGGQVFRIDIDNTNTGTASLVERARTLGKFGVSGSESNLTLANRRFYDPLSIAYVQDQMINKSYIAVATASGWREHPFETAVDNRLYVIRDEEPLKSNAGQSISTTVYPITHAHLTTSMIDLDTLATGDSDAEVSANLAKLSNAVVVTKALSQSGEKAFGSPSIAANGIFFSTLLPPADINDVSLIDNTACTRSTGKARTYGLSLLNGAGMLPNPIQPDDSDTVDTVEFIEFDSAVAAGHISVHLDADGGGTVSSGHTAVSDMAPPSERAERMYWKQSNKGKQVNWEAYYGSSSTQTEEESGGDDQGGGDGQGGDDGGDDDDDDDDD